MMFPLHPQTSMPMFHSGWAGPDPEERAPAGPAGGQGGAGAGEARPLLPRAARSGGWPANGGWEP